MLVVSGSLGVSLGGCLLTDKPEPNLDIPNAYDGASRNPRIAEAALPKLDWWRTFRSKELTTIVERARGANLDIAAAIARIVQADAQARVAGAPLLPDVSLGADASHSRSSQTHVVEQRQLIRRLRARQPVGHADRELRDRLLGQEPLGLAFGRRRRSRQPLRPRGRRALDRGERGQRLFRGTGGAGPVAGRAREPGQRQRVLDLIKQRVNAGTASDLEVAQQESLVNGQRAAIPPLVQTLTQNRNALALLMARSPESVRVRGGSLNAIRIPRVTPGLPSELLAQRPDIREAEANLAAANANVENARAQMLPSITLTADGGYSSAVLKTLLRPESALYSLGAGLAQPIFDGQKLQGNLDLQKGKQDELLQTYRKAVISAFVDVENALNGLRQTALRERLQRDVVASSRRAFNIAEQRLREGTVDLVTVLQTQQTLYSAQDSLVQARLAHVQAIVTLYQALGGGWLSKPVEARNAR